MVGIRADLALQASHHVTTAAALGRRAAPAAAGRPATSSSSAAAAASPPPGATLRLSSSFTPPPSLIRHYSSPRHHNSTSVRRGQQLIGGRGGVRVRRPVAVRAMAGGKEGQQGGGSQPWDVFRFARTVLFFNEPPSVQSILESVLSAFTGVPANTAAATAASNIQQQQQGVVLVVGATGGVGKRVVDALRSKGVTVRALVRNTEKARSLLGQDVDVVTADLTQLATLQPSFFTNVTSVVNASAVTVVPKEGDTADRQKYKQGIKFYDPEIIGDTPEAVEYRGMLNLLTRVRSLLAAAAGNTNIFALNAQGLPVGAEWGALDDVVMGGVSESYMQYDKTGGEGGAPAALFTGSVSTSNNGGFVSVRTKNLSPPLDLSSFGGLELRLFGDGQRYKMVVRTEAAWDAVGYTMSFDTTAGGWQTIRLPFSSFVPVFRTRTVANAPPLNASSIASLQLMLSKFEYDGRLNPSFRPGAFSLPLTSIDAYAAGAQVPRFVHVGSAGVTRPKRPGLDLSKQPPAVRMNDELGGILTWKLRGEDAIRASGLPFTIIRPCALTEEPAGAELEFEQGDNITGKIGREEVARICVAALSSPAAANKTFEVKSTVPFSTPFTVDPNNPPPARDYTLFFESLKKGVTGKELLAEEDVAMPTTVA